MPVRDVLRGGRAAAMLLTRIPMGAGPPTRAEWRWAAGWIPATGAGIGLALAAVWWLAAPLGPFPAALMVYTAGLLLTGALHEDGLADTADALGGATDRPGIHRILKDSRVGSYGALALVASYTLRAALLASLTRAAPLALVLTQCGSRVPLVWLLRLLPYVTPEDLSKSRAVASARWLQVLLATWWLVAMLVGFWAWGRLSALEVAVVAAVIAAAGALCGIWFRRRAGGVTGDFLGATQQVTEAAMLVVLAALWPGKED